MVDVKEAEQFIKKARENSRKRNFNQTFDVIINLRDLDIKKPEEKLDFFTELKYPVKKVKVCALVGPELNDEAKKHCDTVILANEFDKYAKDVKKVKKLANEHDFFIGQANIMPQIASTFGKILGRRGKMPNPKAGGVVPPNANLKSTIDRLSKTVRVRTKADAAIRVIIGKEDMDDNKLAENLAWLIDQLLHHLPMGNDNIKSMLIKTTMGRVVKIQ
jgi:large subunit ribosomal protein L1